MKSLKLTFFAAIAMLLTFSVNAQTTEKSAEPSKITWNEDAYNFGEIEKEFLHRTNLHSKTLQTKQSLLLT